jgi:hypothetical protein
MDIEEGGLEMINLFSFVKSKQIKVLYKIRRDLPQIFLFSLQNNGVSRISCNEFGVNLVPNSLKIKFWNAIQF